MLPQADFDLHGVVGVRVEDPQAGDIGVVSRQLGPIQGHLDREPDISIRFVDRIPTGRLTYVGRGETGYDDDEFFVLRGGAKARLPFDAVGEPMQILCERGLPAVPHLLSCINMTALQKGVLALHASAYELGGRGVLVMGWAKGGKTEALLAGMDRGAQYIGDEWVYLTGDADMYGLPEPIRLWDWHLEQQPRVLAARSLKARARLATWRRLAAAAGGVAAVTGSRGGLARRAHPLLQRQAFLQIPPADLFGPDRVSLRGRLDAAVLVLSHEGAECEVRPAGADEISGRMRASLVHERQAFLDHYQQFAFAFPSRRNRNVETASDRETELLRSLFDFREAVVVAHPYPCDIAALGDAVSVAVGDVLGRQRGQELAL